MSMSLLGLAQQRGMLDISHLRLRTKRCEMKHRREVEFLNLSREMKQGLVQKVKAFYSLRSHRSLSTAQVLLADAMSCSMSLNRLTTYGKKALQEWGYWTQWKKGGNAKAHNASSRRETRQLAQVLQEWSEFAGRRAALAKRREDVRAAKEETAQVMEAALQDMQHVKDELHERDSECAGLKAELQERDAECAGLKNKLQERDAECAGLKLELEGMKKALEAREAEELELQAEKFRLKEAVLRLEMELRTAVRGLEAIDAEYRAWKESAEAAQLEEDKISTETTRESAEACGLSEASAEVDGDLTRSMRGVEERRACVDFWKETKGSGRGELLPSELTGKESRHADVEERTEKVRVGFEDLRGEVSSRVAEVESLRDSVARLRGREQSLEQRVRELEAENATTLHRKSHELRALKAELEAMEQELAVVVMRSEAADVARAATEREERSKVDELHQLLGAAKATSAAEAKAREKAELDVGVEATRRARVEEALSLVAENAELRMAAAAHFGKRFCKAAARRRCAVLRRERFQAWRGLSEARKDRQAVSRAQAAAEEEALRGWAVDCLRQNARQQKSERERNLKMLTARSLQRKREQEEAALYRRRLASLTLLPNHSHPASFLPNLSNAVSHFDVLSFSEEPLDENDPPHNRAPLRVPLTTKFLKVWSESSMGVGPGTANDKNNAVPRTKRLDADGLALGSISQARPSFAWSQTHRFDAARALAMEEHLFEPPDEGERMPCDSEASRQRREPEEEKLGARESEGGGGHERTESRGAGGWGAAAPSSRRACTGLSMAEEAAVRERETRHVSAVLQEWRGRAQERMRARGARVLVWVCAAGGLAGAKEREERERWEVVEVLLARWWERAREHALRRTLASHALQDAVAFDPRRALQVWDEWTKQRVWARTTLAPFARQHVVTRRLEEVGGVAIETQGCRC